MGVGHRGSSDLLPEQDRWRVRICDSDGAVLGAGILLGTQHVLTCAHVVGTEHTAPESNVVIDFVGLGRVPSAKAWVVADGWVPPNDVDGGDVALLKLEAPQPTGSTTPLRRLPANRGRMVYTCGFPRYNETGEWVDGELSGRCGPGGECVQMNAEWVGRQVRAGFSGAPVFDKATQCVIGMVVSKFLDESAGISWMLPVETIVRHLPQVSGWVSGAKATDPSLTGILEPEVPDVNLARQVAAWLKQGTDNILNVVTGKSDSPASAIVRRAINLADQEQRPTSTDPRVAQAPEGTVPPPGSIDLAVDATGKTPDEVFRRIADRAGIPVDESTTSTVPLQDSLPPMTMVVSGIDDAAQPEALVTDVLEPLADRGHRLLLVFHEEFSPSLTIARSLTDSAPLSSDPNVIMESTELPDNNQPVDTEWMCAGLVPLPILSFPDPATRVLRRPTPPEQGRICGKNGCTAVLGRDHAGQPAPTEGRCQRCNTPFSLTPELSAGDLIADRYEIVGCLARGGLGWVYLAKDTNLDNYVALKRLINTNDARALALEASERHFLTNLNHPNIVRIYNFVTHPDLRSGELTGYIVMEYVDGWSMAEAMHIAAEQQDAMGGPLLVEHVVAYGIEILGAFEYLHGQGLLYCDMKPSNVMRSSNCIKIIDLGATRRIDDRRSPIVEAPRYRAPLGEGRSVRSDIHTIGKTLEDLLSMSADVLMPTAELGSDHVSFGIESFRRALARASHKRASKRFPSAAAMSQQLRGVLREILSLREGTTHPESSTMFTVTAALLDAGLGTVPPLASWTSRSVERGAMLDDGRPSAATVAISLPVPQAKADDPAVNFLATVSATDLRLLIDQLAAFPDNSTEIQLRSCRAYLELADLKNALTCLHRAAEILGSAAEHDWRIAWHHGLLALASGEITAAGAQFAEVYGALPGEDAPKLALGFCYEELGKLDDADRYYKAVWRRDHSQASAAFGIARVCLRRGNRNDAVTVLDEIPDVSRHCDAARIAAVRVLSGSLSRSTGSGNGLPTVADLRAVVRRLPAVRLDGGETHGPARTRLVTAVREVALVWIRETGDGSQLDGHEILGDHVTKRRLRELLEGSFRALAQQAPNAVDHGVLIDLANAVRPWTAW